jgi:hypothetical protein
MLTFLSILIARSNEIEVAMRAAKYNSLHKANDSASTDFSETTNRRVDAGMPRKNISYLMSM